MHSCAHIYATFSVTWAKGVIQDELHGQLTFPSMFLRVKKYVNLC